MIKIFIFCSFLSAFILTTRIISNQASYYTHRYRIHYAIWVIEAENQTQPIWLNVHVCHLKNEEKLQLCKEAMVYPMARQHKVRLVEGQTAGEAKNYQMRLSDPIKDGARPIIFNPPPVINTACQCPTDPPIYLKDFADGGDYLDAYIAGQQKYGQEPDRSLHGCEHHPPCGLAAHLRSHRNRSKKRVPTLPNLTYDSRTNSSRTMTRKLQPNPELGIHEIYS